MQIGELSRRSGISVRMLRYYEQEGLLTPSRRDSGYRDYDANQERLVLRVHALSKAGLKLETIRQLLPCVVSDRPDFEPCPEVLETLRREVDTISQKIDCLSESRQLLAGYLTRTGRRTMKNSVMNS